jgi:cytochrome c553
MNQVTSRLAAALASAFAPAFAAALLATAAVGSASAQDAAEGQKKAAMCIGCHGIVGYQASFPEVHKVPMISGQNAKYIVAALNAYKKGDRKHPSMRGIAGQMSDKDMADVAAFYEKHTGGAAPKLADTPAVAPSEKVQALLAKGACASCHGANFSKPIDGSYPKIAGQHADYLRVALTAYGRDSTRVGRNNAIMAGQVKNFNSAELKLLANYIGSLPSELQVVPQSSFR